MRHILGISAFYHDSAAALIRDGNILAAAQEERFTRKKNDESFPTHAINFCLRHAGITARGLDAVVFYDKPVVKFARMLETYLAVAPRGLGTFLRFIPIWLGEKLNVPAAIEEAIPDLGACPILFTRHHEAHAASAFYPSPFDEAAILTIDGVGEWATTTIGRGSGNDLQILKELRFPHSLGLLYSAFTAYCGFRVNSGEYKLMGLAPYGEPKYASAIRDNLIELKDDGSFRLNLDYFDFLHGLRMTNARFDALFGGPPRTPETRIEQRYADVARSIQLVTEEVILRLARHAREITNSSNLCLAGGVALNCVANGLIVRERIFDKLWIQPAAGDAGGALGAALAVWHRDAKEPRKPNPQDSMSGSLLGPYFSQSEIEQTLRGLGAVFEVLDDEKLFARAVDLLSTERVVAWFQGRMEFGPRALGSRSILADARSQKMQSTLNLKVKFRESFRPFAPIVRRERLHEYFDLNIDSPYMLIVAPLKQELRLAPDPARTGFDRLKQPHSTLPVITHVDFSARIQTVTRAQNPRLYRLLEAFEHATGCGVLVNTSFNVRGEPIVCTPEDAYRSFVNTEIDFLIIGNCVIDRLTQPARHVTRKGELQPD
jgi:carbamoyltransferase